MHRTGLAPQGCMEVSEHSPAKHEAGTYRCCEDGSIRAGDGGRVRRVGKVVEMVFCGNC